MWNIDYYTESHFRTSWKSYFVWCKHVKRVSHFRSSWKSYVSMIQACEMWVQTQMLAISTGIISNMLLSCIMCTIRYRFLRRRDSRNCCWTWVHVATLTLLATAVVDIHFLFNSITDAISFNSKLENCTKHKISIIFTYHTIFLLLLS